MPSELGIGCDTGMSPRSLCARLARVLEERCRCASLSVYCREEEGGWSCIFSRPEGAFDEEIGRSLASQLSRGPAAPLSDECHLEACDGGINLAVPLRSLGETIGIVLVGERVVGEYGDADLEQVARVCAFAGLKLHNLVLIGHTRNESRFSDAARGLISACERKLERVEQLASGLHYPADLTVIEDAAERIQAHVKDLQSLIAADLREHRR